MSTILLNSAFVGSYADEKCNLSHEVINFVRADDGKYYIYLSPYGHYTRKFDYVLFVKNCNNGIVEILAKAEVKNPTDEDKIFSLGITQKKGKSTQICDKSKAQEYTRKVKNADIEYGKTSLAKIHNQDQEPYDKLFITMEVKEIVLPKCFIGITLESELENEKDKIFKLSGKKKLTPQSMRCYFDSDNITESESYEKLLKIINNTDFWGDTVKTFDEQKQDIEDEQKKDAEVDDNFFKVTLQQDNEVIFSNMMYYFFQNYFDMFTEFAKEVLGLDDIGSIGDNPLWITREEGRIDLKVVTDKYFIIIENKIKSGINGINGTDDDGKIKSQLLSYYQEAEKSEEANGKTIKGFVFSPNYNVINLENYSMGCKYTKVEYSKIYEFFKLYHEKYPNIKYMEDFVKALTKHTKNADNEKRNDLMRRLKARIKS